LLLKLEIFTFKEQNKLINFLAVSLFVNSLMIQQVYAQKVDLRILCQKYPLNSRCQGNNQEQQQINSLESKADIIKINLEASGTRNEWIRIETTNSEANKTVLNAYHATRVKQNLLSGITTNLLNFGLGQLAGEVIDGYKGPVPVPDINFYRWADHKTRRLTFVPDSCLGNSSTSLENFQLSGQPSCAVTGSNSITLPVGTNIYAGILTIEYTEKNLIRTITFRVPKNK
jgi:hypothetical protein